MSPASISSAVKGGYKAYPAPRQLFCLLLLANNHSNGLTSDSMPRKADSMPMIAMEKIDYDGDKDWPDPCWENRHGMRQRQEAGNPGDYCHSPSEGCWRPELESWRNKIKERNSQEVSQGASTEAKRNLKNEGKKKNDGDFNVSFWRFPSPLSSWPLIFKDKWPDRKKQGHNFGTRFPGRKCHFLTPYFKKAKGEDKWGRLRLGSEKREG